MKYITDLTDFHITEPTAISLGKFDGLHRGHECLMEHLARKKIQGLQSVVFTFDIPPACKTGEKKQIQVLTTNREKMRLFERQGIDYLIQCPFTTDMMHMEPEEFVEMLTDRLQVKSMVVGTDFRFGHQRRGDHHLLKKMSEVCGYQLEVVDKVQENGRDISSTYIREEILQGHMEHAYRLLGYPYFVEGIVVHGKKLGRTLNIPTLNQLPSEEKLLPPFGVYVTRTFYGGRTYGGITNVGCKPTIEGKNPIGVETHLFEFQEEIYGQEIKVEFLKAVRPEQRFASLEDLKAQMQRDIAAGKEYFSLHKQNCY